MDKLQAFHDTHWAKTLSTPSEEEEASSQKLFSIDLNMDLDEMKKVQIEPAYLAIIRQIFR